MKKITLTIILALIVLALIALAIAIGGCTGPARKTVVTVGPTAIPETVTPTPRPAVASPTVAVSGGTTTIKGTGNQYVKGVLIGEGVYVVDWSGSGTFLSFSLTDAGNNGGDDLAKGLASGERLLIVDGGALKPGEYTMVVASDGGWTVNIARPDTSSPSTLPLTVSCGEREGAVTKPFQAYAGDLWIGYALSRAPSGTGYVNIYNAMSGQSFYTRPIAGEYTSGQSMATVPADGVYIAQVTLPGGSSHGDITMSQ